GDPVCSQAPSGHLPSYARSSRPCQLLEPCAVKVARTVLRGAGPGNRTRLPGGAVRRGVPDAPRGRRREAPASSPVAGGDEGGPPRVRARPGRLLDLAAVGQVQGQPPWAAERLLGHASAALRSGNRCLGPAGPAPGESTRREGYRGGRRGGQALDA